MNSVKKILSVGLVSILVSSQVCNSQSVGISKQSKKTAEPERSSLEYHKELNTYIGNLERLRGLWQEAVRLTYGGDIQQAYNLINQQLPLTESNVWHKRSKDIGKYLRAIDERWQNSYLDSGARALICLDCPQLAIEYLQELQKKKGKLDFSHTIHLSQGFLETGEYQKAKQLLQSLITEGTSDDWKERLNARTEKIDELITTELDNPYCVPIFREDFNWCRNRLGPIIWTWQCGQDLEHLNILASLFKSTGDNYGHNLVLRIIANAEVSGVSKSQSAGAILELGNKAHKAKDYEQAIKLWQQIENDYNNTPAWGKAVFNIGIALKEQKQFDDAIKQFEKLLTSNVNDMERGSNIMQAYRNYRAHAQWEIANCLLAQEKYCDALGAYQASQTKHAFHSWCGTCLDSYESRCALYQGLCLEHLRRYDEAVKAYFSWVTQRLSANSTMCIRIVDLYQSNNQIETLLKVLDEIDNYLKDKAVKEHGRQIVDDPDFDEHMFTKTIRRILEIRQLGKNQEVSSLVELVVTASPEVYPYRYRDRVRRWDAIEAAKALAQHPHKAVPLLKERMSGDNRSKLIYYALALCKTDEAVKILKESVPEAKNAWQKKSLEYAMTLLDKTYLPSEADDGIYFPDLPTNIGLPKKLSEIDEEAAFEESIPKSMNLDLSTPQATINSLLTAALIGNKNLYERCIWDCPELSRAYEDVAELSRKRTFRHEQSPSVFTSDDTAEITVQIADERKTERVVFILCSKNEQWLITGFRELRLSSTPTMP